MATGRRQWWQRAAVVLALVVAGCWWGLQHWLGSDDLRQRAANAASEAVGVPVTLGHLGLDLWPVPGLALEAVRIETRPVWTLQRVEARVVLGALLRGRLDLASLSIHQADASQAGWEYLVAQRSKRPPAPSGDMAVPWPRSLKVDSLTWRPVSGAPITLDGEARLAPDGLPDTLRAQVRSGPLQGAELALTRQQLTWDLRARVAGGTVRGPITLDRMPVPGAAPLVSGRLVTEGIDVGMLSRQRLSGRLSATTTLELRTGGPGALLDALQTRSQFAVRDAVVHGVDLARAVKTVGLSRGGETRLDALAGQVATRGQVVNLSNLVASSGLLTASGQVNISARQALQGRVLVHLGPAAIGQAVGVPLVVGGTLEEPQLTLTRSAMLGAAIGTMVMPGVGTGAGASIGDKMGNAFQGLFRK
jgi:uncharacterized protein involved in outer membrane biogenesis